ncbi:MAG TPA: DUF935 family protein, partial [Gaiellaceae bacterium]|nr:DUF935 family protein [Gaiellaceae bacterium]
GFALGVAIGELVPVPGRDYPVLVRLDPEFLQYIWVENRWYFISLAGRLPITPGDGRWILHTPGPRMSPWQFGLWPALARSFINKEHAMSYRSNYAAKLANPARVAYSPLGATEVERNGMLAKLISWGLNSVFELPPGWEAKILESNGRGWEVFQRQIDTSDYEIMIALAGQIVTTEGGTGFSNIEAPEKIRADLIEDDGDALAYTIATQGLPQYTAGIWGEDAVLERNVYVDWATEKPKDRDREAEIMAKVATGIRALGVSLAPYNRRLNVTEITTRFQIPIEGDPDAVAPPGPNDEPAPVSTPALEPPADGGGDRDSKPANEGLRDGQDVDEPEDDDKAAQ